MFFDYKATKAHGAEASQRNTATKAAKEKCETLRAASTYRSCEFLQPPRAWLALC